jgi:hypothetical protein
VSLFEGLECLDDDYGIAQQTSMTTTASRKKGGDMLHRNQQVILSSIQKKAESFAPAGDGGGEKSAV